MFSINFSKVSDFCFNVVEQVKQKFGMGLVDYTAKIPPEIFENVLSFLNRKDLQKAAAVNSYWKDCVIDWVKYDRYTRALNFIEFLANNLNEDQYPDQVKQLFNLAQNKRVLLDFMSGLEQIDAFCFNLKKDLINILRSLSSRDLNSLKELSGDREKPDFLQDIFSVLSIYEEVDNLGKSFLVNQGAYLNSCYISLSKRLLRIEDPEEAFKVAKKITNMDCVLRSEIICDISGFCARKGRFQEALEMTQFMRSEDSDNALSKIAHELIQRGDKQRARDAIERIGDEFYKSVWLSRLLLI